MHKSGGFTLVELFIALAVAAVLLTLAAPAFLDTIARARLDSATSGMVGAINLARSEAVKRARVATLCSRSEDDDGNPVCGDDDDWADGWIVLAAGLADPVRVGDPTNDIIVDTEVEEISFEATGRRGGGAGDLAFCLSGRADTVRRITVGPLGRVTTETLEACP
jgi:type IV fimbrial biogenesis protein FimT